MVTYLIRQDILVFGTLVISFPAGVKAAFDALMAAVPDSEQRSYYGLSHLDKDGRIIYYAAVEEQVAGEGKILGYDYYSIPKGEYLAVTISDWMTKTDCIKDVFHDMMQDPRFDHITPCIEWYKSDKEMLCLLKTKEAG